MSCLPHKWRENASGGSREKKKNAKVIIIIIIIIINTTEEQPPLSSQLELVAFQSIHSPQTSTQKHLNKSFKSFVEAAFKAEPPGASKINLIFNGK